MGFLCGLTATAAYLGAGYRATGGAARANASRLLTNTHIARFLEQRREKQLRDLGIIQEKVLKELAALAFSNIADFVTYNSRGMYLKDMSLLRPEQIGALDALKLDNNDCGRVICIKLRGKLRALDLLGRHLGLWGRGRKKAETCIFPFSIKTSHGSESNL